MNRRHTLKLLIAASLSTTTVGYWAQGKTAIDELVKTSIFTSTEHDLITAIADTIIPQGEKWGALSLGVPIYLLGYFNKCVETDVQKNIQTQLAALDVKASSLYKRAFLQCTPAERESLLLAFSKSDIDDEKNVFDLLKAQCIRGFRTSKDIMTGPYRYRIVPGHYKGCIDVNDDSIA